MKSLTVRVPELTKEQLVILCAIRRGRVTLRELAKTIGQTVSMMHRRELPQLIDLGLVDCAVGSHSSLHLTEAGRAVVKCLALIRYSDGRVEVGQAEVIA